jgi:hypothetical protein
MWVKENFFKVNKEERQVFNHKLEELYKSHGHYIEVIENSPWFQDQRAIAYLEFNHRENEMTFKCGTFWYEEENICPVIAMTHELGHYIDITENFNGDWLNYNRTLGTLELEVRAWERGIEFCKKLGLDKYKEAILQYAHECLGSYFNAWYLPNDRRFNFTGRKPTFQEAMNRVRLALGLEPEAIREEPKNDFLESLRRLEELIGDRRTVQFNPCGETEEELSPLERVKKRKEKYRQTVKKGMGAKTWEL